MSIVVKDCESIEDILADSGVYASVTEGISMRPLFRTHRDMVILKRADGICKKYDVVLYRTNSKYILHRIVKVDTKNKIYLIRGDNTYRIERVPFDAVIAVLDSFNRKGKSGKVTDFGYKLYSRLRTLDYPLRYIIRAPYFVARAIYHKLRSKG